MVNRKEINSQLKVLNIQIRELRNKKRLLLSQLESIPKPEPVLVVASVELKPLIQLWIDEGRTLIALANEASVNHKTLKRILSGETKFNDEIIADSIRIAVGVPYYELRFVPDPRKRPQSQYYEE